MRNDVSIPPEASDEADDELGLEPEKKRSATHPILPVEGPLKADVTLYDHPAMQAAGAGNFWGLAIIGLIFAGIAAIILWIFSGYMKR